MKNCSRPNEKEQAIEVGGTMVSDFTASSELLVAAIPECTRKDARPAVGTGSKKQFDRQFARLWLV